MRGCGGAERSQAAQVVYRLRNAERDRRSRGPGSEAGPPPAPTWKCTDPRTGHKLKWLLVVCGFARRHGAGAHSRPVLGPAGGPGNGPLLVCEIDGNCLSVVNIEKVRLRQLCNACNKAATGASQVRLRKAGQDKCNNWLICKPGVPRWLRRHSSLQSKHNRYISSRYCRVRFYEWETVPSLWNTAPGSRAGFALQRCGLATSGDQRSDRCLCSVSLPSAAVRSVHTRLLSAEGQQGGALLPSGSGRDFCLPGLTRCKGRQF